MKKRLQKKIIIPVLLFAALILSAAVAFAYFHSGETQPEEGDAENMLTVSILKVGKADAMIFRCGGKTMIIDCGEEDDGEEMADFLESSGIRQIDVLLITHFDRDHVGGADTVVNTADIGRILLPDYEGTHAEYDDFMNTLQNKGLVPERLTGPVTFSLGNAEVLVEPPGSYEIPTGEAEYDNNFSLITTVTHGSNRLLFTGDIEKERIRAWLEAGDVQPCGFLKMPHHGNFNKQTEALLKAVQPEYAVITCSDKNPADQKTLDLLGKYGCETLLTKDGNITVTSSAAGLEVRQKGKR